jgi:hypothetical protein
MQFWSGWVEGWKMVEELGDSEEGGRHLVAASVSEWRPWNEKFT